MTDAAGEQGRDAASARASANALRRGAESLQRENRWKRRRSRDWGGPATRIGIVVIVGALGAFFGLAQLLDGPAGPGASDGFRGAVRAAFPEADLSMAELRYAEVEGAGSVPAYARIHLPAHMLRAPSAETDPFSPLGASFGATDRALSGEAMAQRLGEVAAEVLPADLPRCHTWRAGARLPATPERGPLRVLHVELNPGC